MQRWLTVVAVVAGLAVIAIATGMRVQRRGGAAIEANRVALHREREPKLGPQGAAPAPRLLPGKDLGARLRALRGRPVVLNAWASWCPPCREELPFFAAAAERFRGRAAFLGADVEDDAPGARDLLAEVSLGYPSYQASLGQLQPLAHSPGTPFTVYIAPGGEAASVHIGAYRSADELDADIEALASDRLSRPEMSAERHRDASHGSSAGSSKGPGSPSNG